MEEWRERRNGKKEKARKGVNEKGEKRISKLNESDRKINK